MIMKENKFAFCHEYYINNINEYILYVFEETLFFYMFSYLLYDELS